MVRQLDYMTSVSCFFSEFMATAVLLLIVLAISDQRNGPPPPGLNPLVLFITILGIGACLGMETAYAINPARDLGPRILTAMVGYGSDVFTYRRYVRSVFFGGLRVVLGAELNLIVTIGCGVLSLHLCLARSRVRPYTMRSSSRYACFWHRIL